MNVNSSIQKNQAVVGSLLTFSIEIGSRYLVGSWYRVVDSIEKIVKMQRIKQDSLSTSYRCCVFDIGAMIQLRLEGYKKQEEVHTFGPIKFDSYLLKQLEQCKNNYSFAVGIHLKVNKIISCKLRSNILQNGEIQLQIETKKQQIISLLISPGNHWRMFQEIFTIGNCKLTEICIKQIFNTEAVKSQLKQLNIDLEDRNNLTVVFLNVVQRNLFLAQIIKKLISQGSCMGRPSQIRSIKCKQDQKSIQNQFDDIFASRPQLKSSMLSQKIYNDFKDVVFTPQSGLQREQERQNNEKYFSIFDHFLNPQQCDKDRIHRLTDIAEDDQQDLKQSRKLKIKKVYPNINLQQQYRTGYPQIEALIIKCRQISEQFKQPVAFQFKSEEDKDKYIKKILQQKELLIRENQRLKKQNKILKLKFESSKISTPKIPYQLPKFLKIANKSFNSCKLTDFTMCKTSDINPNTGNPKLQIDIKNRMNTENFTRKYSRASQRKQYEEDLKKKFQQVTMSSKIAIKFPQNVNETPIATNK